MAEIILFFPKSLKDQVVIKGTIIGEDCIRFSKEVKNVGVWLDENLIMLGRYVDDSLKIFGGDHEMF